MIYGKIQNYNLVPNLSSWAEEFSFEQEQKIIWGRIEGVERTARQLGIADGNLDEPHWVYAATLGYTHHVATVNSLEIKVGASGTEYIVPGVFKDSYGDPWAAKVFLQISGMKMHPN